MHNYCYVKNAVVQFFDQTQWSTEDKVVRERIEGRPFLYKKRVNSADELTRFLYL